LVEILGIGLEDLDIPEDSSLAGVGSRDDEQ
jgi:hypothetical protein